MEKILAQKLLQIKAIRLNPQNPFRWASGIISPIYCDNRIVLSHPPVRNLVKQGLADISADFGDFDAVAGVATAGIAHGALLADALGKPFVYVRSKRKAHGRQNLIEGELPADSSVLIVEDLVSTGGSCIKAIEVVQEAGAEVVGALALFTYGFPEADRAFESIGCKLRTLSNYNDMLEAAQEGGYLNSEEKELLAEWSRAPREWKGAKA